MHTLVTEIKLSKYQRAYCDKACNTRRFVWNWAVTEYFTQAQNNIFPSSYDLQKQLNNTLVKDPNYSWLNEVNSMVRQESLKDFGLAIKKYAKARYESKRKKRRM